MAVYDSAVARQLLRGEFAVAVGFEDKFVARADLVGNVVVHLRPKFFAADGAFDFCTRAGAEGGGAAAEGGKQQGDE